LVIDQRKLSAKLLNTAGRVIGASVDCYWMGSEIQCHPGTASSRLVYQFPCQARAGKDESERLKFQAFIRLAGK
jgi:hypothetical protein